MNSIPTREDATQAQKRTRRRCTACGWQGNEGQCHFGHNDFYCPACGKESLALVIRRRKRTYTSLQFTNGALMGSCMGALATLLLYAFIHLKDLSPWVIFPVCAFVTASYFFVEYRETREKKRQAAESPAPGEEQEGGSHGNHD